MLNVCIHRYGKITSGKLSWFSRHNNIYTSYITSAMLFNFFLILRLCCLHWLCQAVAGSIFMHVYDLIVRFFWSKVFMFFITFFSHYAEDSALFIALLRIDLYWGAIWYVISKKHSWPHIIIIKIFPSKYKVEPAKVKPCSSIQLPTQTSAPISAGYVWQFHRVLAIPYWCVKIQWILQHKRPVISENKLEL